MATTFGFANIRVTNDLGSFLLSRLGAPSPSGNWLCPFHADTNPNLHITPDGEHFKCFACDATGDVVDLVARFDGITVREAVKRLSNLNFRPGNHCKASVQPTQVQVAKPAAKSAWQDRDWQKAIDGVIRYAEAQLWESVGHPALDWLRERGLEDSTIRRFRLGFVASEQWHRRFPVLGQNRQGEDHKLFIPRGITIPWVRPGSWYASTDDEVEDPGSRWVGCNVRRLSIGDITTPLSEGPKYQALKGSERGHCYPFSDMVRGLPALVTEGELDALLAWQEAAAFVNVLTIGGVSQRPQQDAMNALAECPIHLLAFDHDVNHAGDLAAQKFSELSAGRARRLWLPSPANDLTDFHRALGKIPDWLASESARFGQPWPPTQSHS
ncbi:CHC2 zinc finger domain-containing protein [Singulisphaera sp. Ch08]|uniref:CHC2 zinc finger domain-containing protein n=1 Tax=Singulisphaera sp. Ch08 TaxID=3120278 RepID=A0AAU7CMP3_9BACT